MSVDATILITTKDRRKELARALRSALSQQGSFEVLVFDDGSSDGTFDLVRRKFCQARLVRSESPLGIVAARNLAMRHAKGRIVITIDDDCIFSDSHTLSRVLTLFRCPKVGAVAIPHVSSESALRECLSETSRGGGSLRVTDTFIGCASAVRRDLFLELGGYSDQIWRQGEELDYCTRLLDKGFATVVGNGPPVLHLESAKRSTTLIERNRARNSLYYCWRNVPFAFLLPHLIMTIIKNFAKGTRAGTASASTLGFLDGLRCIVTRKWRRLPVSTRAYRISRRTRRRGPLPLRDVHRYLGWGECPGPDCGGQGCDTVVPGSTSAQPCMTQNSQPMGIINRNV